MKNENSYNYVWFRFRSECFSTSVFWICGLEFFHISYNREFCNSTCILSWTYLLNRFRESLISSNGNLLAQVMLLEFACAFRLVALQAEPCWCSGLSLDAGPAKQALLLKTQTAVSIFCEFSTHWPGHCCLSVPISHPRFHLSLPTCLVLCWTRSSLCFIVCSLILRQKTGFIHYLLHISPPLCPCLWW